MERVHEILGMKGWHEVISIEPDTTVLEAADKMNRYRIGSLVVVQNDKIAGIISERDVLTRVVVARLDPARTLVSQVMTSPVICCRTDTSLDDAASLFKVRRIRHLPVMTDTGELAGIVSIGDLNAYRVGTQERTIVFMADYINGRV